MSADEKNRLDSTIGVGMCSGTRAFDRCSLTKAFEKSSYRALAGLGKLGHSSMAWAEVAAEILLLPLCVNVKICERRGNSCHSLIYLWVGVTGVVED